MKTVFTCAKIEGVAAAVPCRRRDLREYSSIWGTAELDRIMEGTGITTVREAPKGMTTSDLCHAAAVKLLEELSVDPSSVDGIVFVSQTPDYALPATSAILQERLGMSRAIAAFDINYGCSGYVYGLLQAHMMIGTGLCSSVLVCAGDITTSMVHPKDRALRMLFGDGGSATLVSAGEGRHGFSVRTDGSGARSLLVPAGGCRTPRSPETAVAHEAEDGNVRSAENLYMDGIAVLMFALREVPQAIDEVLELASWSRSDVGFYGLHQANRFMVEYLAKKLRADAAAAPFSCAEVGNAGPASIPVLLAAEKNRLHRENRLDRVVLCGFGVGFSVAAATLSLENTRILDLIDLDEVR